MQTANGFQPCYHAQAAVDDESMVIVAVEVTNHAGDVGRLVPMLDAGAATVGEQPGRVLADAGYRSEATLLALEARRIDGYVALGREGKQVTAGVGAGQEATARMKSKLATTEGTAHYRRRQYLAEPPVGWIQSCLGFRQFSRRGLAKVRPEWRLMGLAMKLRRLNHQMEWT